MHFLKSILVFIVPVLLLTCSEFTWHTFLSKQIPLTHWDDVKHKREFFDWLSEELGVEHFEDWFKFGLKDVRTKGNQRLWQSMNTSYIHGLQMVYPEFVWLPWKFENTTHRFWEKKENQRQFFDWLADEHHIERQEDWYRLNGNAVLNTNASALFHYYNSSFSKALKAVYPEFIWYEWLFVKYPQNFWNERENQRRYFDWLADILQLRQQSDWFSLTVEQVQKNHGGGIIGNLYDNLFDAISTVYPEYVWHAWLFDSAPYNYWANLENRRKYFDWLGEQLGIETFEDWYKVKQSHICDNNGGGFLHFYYNSSPSKAIMSVYPEYPWQPWKFQNVSRDYWSEPENVEQFLNWFTKRVGIVEMSDWYRITTDHVAEHSGRMLLHRYGGLSMLLQRFFPDYDWDHNLLESDKTKSQGYLLQHLEKLFPNDKPIINYKHPRLKFATTQKSMELDIFIPSLSIALEYQGAQHYTSQYMFEELEFIQAKDSQKREACASEGITLIEIPYWWDRERDSLIATIHQFRPDLFNFQPKGTPIPSAPPRPKTANYAKEQRKFLHPQEWKIQMDPTSYLVSKIEKGVRVIWDTVQFHLLDNTKLSPPSFFRKGIEELHLDGILKYGNTREECNEILHSKDKDIWKHVTFVVFDVPQLNLVYEERLKALREVTFPPHVRLLDTFTCQGREHLFSLWNELRHKSAYGLMLRNPDSHYQDYGLFRLNCVEEEHALIIGQKKDKLLCELVSGMQVMIHLHEQFTLKSLVGTVIALSHTGLSQTGVPTRSEMVYSKPDLTWASAVSMKFPYYASISKSSKSQCYGCKKRIKTGNTKIALQTFVQRQGKLPMFRTINFCMNSSCIYSSVKDQRKKNAAFLPPFDGCVIVCANFPSERLQSEGLVNFVHVRSE